MITAKIFMDADFYPTNEVSLTLTGEFIDGERGSRDSYGAPIEPDIEPYIELHDIFIEELQKSVSLTEAAELFDKSERDLLIDFVYELGNSQDFDDMPF